MTAVGAAGVLALAAVGMWIAVMAIAQWRDLPPAHHRAEDAAIEWHARRLIARLEDDLRAAAAADDCLVRQAVIDTEKAAAARNDQIVANMKPKAEQ